MLTVKSYVNEWNEKLNKQGTEMKVFKEMFDWNYWMAYKHALLILSTLHDKLHRMLFIFSFYVIVIWKFIRTIYQRIFLTKYHTRSHYIYSEVSLLRFQGKIRGNTWFSQWMFKRLCARGKCHIQPLFIYREVTLLLINEKLTVYGKGDCLTIDWRDFSL